MSKKDTDLHRIKVSMPAIEAEISSFMAAMINENPDIKGDDEFKQDILEGSTDYLEIIDRLVVNLSITQEYITGIQTARARLDDRAHRLHAKEDLIRRLLKRLLDIADMRKVTAPSGTVSIGSRPPSVEIVDEALIPDAFMRISKAPSKTLIGNALKAGEDVPGARLTNGGETLIVR